jgi:hypothetical protein
MRRIEKTPDSVLKKKPADSLSLQVDDDEAIQPPFRHCPPPP